MLHIFANAFGWLILFWMLSEGAVAQDSPGSDSRTTLLAKSSFDSSLLPDIDITLLCTSATPERLTTRMDANSELEWSANVAGNESTYCQVYATLPRGFSVSYTAIGEAASKSDENGCQYAEVVAAQINVCQIEVTQDHVPLTVYKKWIGATGDEGDVPVSLDCGGDTSENPKFINQGLPATWQLSNIPPSGLVCSVSELPDDTFVSDESDCKELLLMAGRGEACTMVNTKVVKRIEMFNRYGKIIMILVMMTAGLIAVRRYV
jgi:hypothetical protein